MNFRKNENGAVPIFKGESFLKVHTHTPPRKFCVGLRQQIEIADCGKIELDPDEQVTFFTSSGKEYDVAAKAWGFYATPSINKRLIDQGFKTALVRNSAGRLYVMVVERDKIDLFKQYLKEEKQSVEVWLDEK